MKIKDYPYGKVSKTLANAVKWLNKKSNIKNYIEKAIKENNQIISFDDVDFSIDYFDMPKNISNKLNPDEIDWLQEEVCAEIGILSKTSWGKNMQNILTSQEDEEHLRKGILNILQLSSMNIFNKGKYIAKVNIKDCISYRISDLSHDGETKFFPDAKTAIDEFLKKD